MIGVKIFLPHFYQVRLQHQAAKVAAPNEFGTATLI
jgi:hypothetical protein